jgi:hypothetical protein
MTEVTIDFPGPWPRVDPETSEFDARSVRRFVESFRPAVERGDSLALLEAVTWCDLELEANPDATQQHPEQDVTCPRWLLAALYRSAWALLDAPSGRKGKPSRRLQAMRDREDAIRWLFVRQAVIRGKSIDAAIGETLERLRSMHRGCIDESSIRRSYYEVERARRGDEHSRYGATVLQFVLGSSLDSSADDRP